MFEKSMNKMGGVAWSVASPDEETEIVPGLKLLRQSILVLFVPQGVGD